MTFDLLIIDNAASKPYETLTLETEPLGGTESTIIRIAEALASMGLRVGIQHDFISEPIMGRYCFYLPPGIYDAKTVVFNRGLRYCDQYPKARKYLWMHDDVTEERIRALCIPMLDHLLKHDIDVLAVSEWHKTQIQIIWCNSDRDKNPKVINMFNPIVDSLYVSKYTEVPYDKNRLVWMSSPHKGLDKALEVFKLLRQFNPDFYLLVFNPGYVPLEYQSIDNTTFMGSMQCKAVWDYVINSLCVLYPTNFKETFGMFAAEANAMHVPVITYSNTGGLPEVLKNKQQIINSGDQKLLIDTVLKWHSGYRPTVRGRTKFKTSEIVKRWLKLFSV